MSRPGGAAAGPAMGGYNTTDGEKPRIVLFIQAHGVCPIEGAANTRSETMIPEGMNLRVFSIPGANEEYNPGLMGVIRPNTFPAHPEFEGKSIDMSFPSILARNLRKRPFARAWTDLKEETAEVYEVSGLGDELRAVGDPFTDIPNAAESRYFQFHPNSGENTSEKGTRATPVNTVRELYGVFIADSNMPEIVASNLPFTTISEDDLELDLINRTKARGPVDPEHLFVEPKYMNPRNMVSRTGGQSIGARHFLKLIADQSCPEKVKSQAILKLDHMWKSKSSTLAHILDVFSVFLFDTVTGELIEGGIDLFIVDPTCRGPNTDFMCPRLMTKPVDVTDSFDFSSQPDLSAPPAAPALPAAPPAPALPAAIAPALPAAIAPAQASSRTSPRRSRHGRSHAPSRSRRGRSRSRSSSSSSSSSSPGRAQGSSQRRNGNSRNRGRGRGRGQGAAQGGYPQAGGNKEYLSISNSGGMYRRTKRKSRHNRTKHRVRRIVNITKRTDTKRRR